MDKKLIKLNDLSFYGDPSSSKYHDSQYIQWDRSGGSSDLVFFTDMCLNMVDLKYYNSSFKVAWLIEPFIINPGPYQYVVQNFRKFDLVLSHHSDLTRSVPNMEFYPNGMSWVAKSDFGLHPKNKCISIIASQKNAAPGHKLRHAIVQATRNSKAVDVFGKAYRPIEHKIEALKDYGFSLAIENCRNPHYFSEKLLDCFLTGTVPIYWGCPEIDKFFNKDGFIECHSPEDIMSAIETANMFKDNDMQGYLNSDKMGKARKENFELAQQYIVAEDWIYQNILQARQLV